MLIYAVDDERFALENLTDSISRALPEAEVISFRSVDELFTYEPEEPCTAAFVDVKLRGSNGLEVARFLQDQNPKINLIFTTGFSEYASRAFRVHASGYIIKPVTPDKVLAEMGHLRFSPKDQTASRVRIRAFGPFEIYIDEVPVSFKYTKTKELLAILVDRKGTLCSTSTICGCLWENDAVDAHRSYLKNLRRDLFTTLTDHGCEEIITRSKGAIGILPSKVTCDYFNYLKGGDTADEDDAYRGEYMTQYSWAEYTHALLDEAYLREHLQ